jgi:hypothetical protein
VNHRLGRILFVLIVSLSVAYLSYQWITNPEPRAERVLQESVVVAAREALKSVVATDTLEIVDPLATNRKVGKAYIYPNGEKGDNGGWVVSGYYRRDENDRWHPYLMTLDAELVVEHLKVRDNHQDMIKRAEDDPKFEATL